MSPEEYPIRELAERAGVSVRTVRYYIQEGLLPAPDTQGRFASYTEEHLDRLELIRRLKEAYLPLKEIRQRVSGLSVQEVREALAQLGPETADQTRVSKLDFSSEVTRATVLYEESNALDYLAQLRENQDNVLRATTMTKTPRPARGLQSQPGDQAEHWERIHIADGIEIHLRQPADTATVERVRQLLALAKKLFSSA